MKLDFIHGYRGFDSRNNLHYLQDGDIVYHAAGAGIVLNTASNNQSFYLEHNDDIICLAVNQNPKYKVRSLMCCKGASTNHIIAKRCCYAHQGLKFHITGVGYTYKNSVYQLVQGRILSISNSVNYLRYMIFQIHPCTSYYTVFMQAYTLHSPPSP